MATELGKKVKCTEANYPTWTCSECAVAHGGFFQENNFGTWNMNRCDVCGAMSVVTKPSDFRYPDYKTVMEQPEHAECETQVYTDEAIRDAHERDKRCLGSSNRLERESPEGAETLIRRVKRAKNSTNRESSGSGEVKKPFRRYRQTSREVDCLEVERSFAEGILVGLQRAKEQIDDSPPEFLAASIFFGEQLQTIGDLVQEVLNQTEEGDTVLLKDYEDA